MIHQGVVLYLNDGGSKFSKDQPFLRTESALNKKFKIESLISIISLDEQRIESISTQPMRHPVVCFMQFTYVLKIHLFGGV